MAVLGEVAHLTVTAVRRLQLCSEEPGSIGNALPRWRCHTDDASDVGQPTAELHRQTLV